MKLSDISDLSKDDVLSALGLSAKPSSSERWLGVAGIFGAGLLIGAGVALLLAPMSGQGLREDLGERLRRARHGDDDAPEESPAASHDGEGART
jgi:hypothetical protein